MSPLVNALTPRVSLVGGNGANSVVIADGRDLLTQHGLAIVKPNLSGDATAVPAAIKSLIDGAQ